MNIYYKFISLHFFLYFQYAFLGFWVFLCGWKFFLLNLLLLGMSCDSGCTEIQFYLRLTIDLIIFTILYFSPIALNVMSLVATNKLIKYQPLSKINKNAIVTFIIMLLLILIVFIKLDLWNIVTNDV